MFNRNPYRISPIKCYEKEIILKLKEQRNCTFMSCQLLFKYQTAYLNMPDPIGTDIVIEYLRPHTIHQGFKQGFL